MEGASYLRFDMVTLKDCIIPAVYSVISTSEFEELYLRITLTRGSGGEGLFIPEKSRPNITIIGKPLPDFSRQQSQVVKVIILKGRRGELAFLKTINFLPNLLARTYARDLRAFEALLENNDGFIREGSVSNLFIIERNTLVTPPLDGQLLAGITRGLVMKLADKIGIRYQEKLIDRENLLSAEEAFLTNSLIEIVPVTAIEGRKIPMGGMTRALQAKYRLTIKDFAKHSP